MEQKKDILKVFNEKITNLFGGNDVKGVNDLYNGLFYYITSCINHEKDICGNYDLCVTFLMILKDTIDSVVFGEDEKK